MTNTPATFNPTPWQLARDWADAINCASHTTIARARAGSIHRSARAARSMRWKGSPFRSLMCSAAVLVVFLTLCAAMLAVSVVIELFAGAGALSAATVLAVCALVAFCAGWWAITVPAITADGAQVVLVRGHGCVEVSDWAYLPRTGPDASAARRSAYELGGGLLTRADEHRVVLAASAAGPKLAEFYYSLGFRHPQTRELRILGLTRVVHWLSRHPDAMLRYPGTPMPDFDEIFDRFAH